VRFEIRLQVGEWDGILVARPVQDPRREVFQLLVISEPGEGACGDGMCILGSIRSSVLCQTHIFH
jgi:hypothetical protein